VRIMRNIHVPLRRCLLPVVPVAPIGLPRSDRFVAVGCELTKFAVSYGTMGFYVWIRMYPSCDLFRANRMMPRARRVLVVRQPICFFTGCPVHR